MAITTGILTMHLLMFRIIGHPAIPDSSWIEIGGGLNVLKTGDTSQAQALAHTLQTINPPYDINQVEPFRDFPQHLDGPGYRRRIDPSKKTAALAIFAASPQLVRELTTIDPVYYATDRIEFGRRRDYSRWVNFVELAGSSRWSEIEPTISSLLYYAGKIGKEVSEPLRHTVASLRGVDRIKGPVAATLKEHLQTLSPFLKKQHQEQLDQCLNAIDRADHFRRAKDRASAWLPYFVLITAATIGLDGDAAGVARLPTGSAVPLTFLAADLAAIDDDKTTWDQRISRLNLLLADLYPGLTLHCGPDGATVTLESREKPAPSSWLELPPVRRIEALMAAASVLHGQRHGNQPIFLLDVNGMDLQPAEQVDLLQDLLRHCNQWQSLVVPDNDFLHLCIRHLGPGGKDGHALAQLIDATPVT
jgi:hypothetical protein